MTLKEGRLAGSKYKALIGEHFDHSWDFEFLDVVAETLARIDFEFEGDDLYDEINRAVEDSLIYFTSQWIIAQFYVSSPADLDWDDVLDEFSNDIYKLAEKIAKRR